MARATSSAASRRGSAESEISGRRSGTGARSTSGGKGGTGARSTSGREGGTGARSTSGGKGGTGGTGAKSTSGSRSGSRSRSAAGGNSGSGRTKQLELELKTEQEQEQERSRQLRQEVALWILVAFCLLLFISNFGVGGAVGGFLSGVLFGLVGIVAYVFPILLLICTFFAVSNKGNAFAAVKLAAAVLLTVFLCALLSLFLTDAAATTPAGAFQFGFKEKSGGGVVGGTLAYLLANGFGTAGAYIVTVIGLIVALVLLTGRLAMRSMRDKGEEVYQSAVEHHEERTRERRRRRKYQKAAGFTVADYTVGPQNTENALRQENNEDRLSMTAGEANTIGQSSVSLTAEEPVTGLADGVSSESKPRSRKRRRTDSMTELQADMIFEEPEAQAQEFLQTEGSLRSASSPEFVSPRISGFVVKAVEPESESQQPKSESQQPESGSQQPESESQQPKSESQQPKSESQQSESGFQQSESGFQRPESGSLRPESGSSQPEPGSLRPEPGEASFSDRVRFQAQDPTDRAYVEDVGTRAVEAADRLPAVEIGMGMGIAGQIEEDEAAGLIEEEDLFPQAAASSSESKASTSSSRSQTTASSSGARRAASKGRSAASEEEKLEFPDLDEQEPIREYVYPPIDLLKRARNKSGGSSELELRETAIKLQQTLKTFGVNVKVTDISCGPAVTRYEIQPEMGVKVSKIVNLADDIKLNLAAADIRIEAPIPGKAAVGIEVPNKENVMVSFRELIESDDFQRSESRISFAVGRDIGGKVKVADIGKMPHLLIAGATGSGKSVCINTIIMSILYKADPNEVKLIMIDPKVVELSVYNGIPHLMIPVVTDPKKAAGALNWAVQEMEDRYNRFAETGSRKFEEYNAKIDRLEVPEGQERPKKMCKLVIIVDELADLMMVASHEVEDAICRLAQLARAAGIHLVIATQRPSVNVITGLIKANMPSRIAFAVTSGIDSRTILDMHGAEKLLGKGDMLFYPQGLPKPLRVQGAFVSDDEVSDVVAFLKENNGAANYSRDVQEKMENLGESGGTTTTITEAEPDDGRDNYFQEAAQIIVDKEKASIGMLQRYLKVGFNRAARIMDQLEEAGIVGPEEGTKPRKVLMTPEEYQQFIDGME